MSLDPYTGAFTGASGASFGEAFLDSLAAGPAPARRRRRRRPSPLGWLALAAAMLAVAVAVWVWPTGPDTPAPPAPAGEPGPVAVEVAGGDVAGEAALATRPMLALPEQAAAPHTLAQHPAPGPGVRLPAATGAIAGVPAGFPPTPEGAIAALAALTTNGLRGADPQVYMRAYQAMAAPGAPPAAKAHLSGQLTQIRATAGLPATGPKAELTMTWQPLQAQVKGVLDGGRYAVVCVLGQFSADYQGRLIAYGMGDCQAMRWTATNPNTGAVGQWLIAPGAAAAPAPVAWPGSQDSVTAGYQEIQP